jgi:hypothetical protein
MSIISDALKISQALNCPRYILMAWRSLAVPKFCFAQIQTNQVAFWDVSECLSGACNHIDAWQHIVLDYKVMCRL